MGSRRKARECALQMLFAADVAEATSEEVVRSYWAELGEPDLDDTAREFATRLASGTLANLELLDARIRSRAEHWRISRMAVVDRNILRLAVYEFVYEPTPRTVAIRNRPKVFHLRSHTIHQRYSRRHQTRFGRRTTSTERSTRARRKQYGARSRTWCGVSSGSERSICFDRDGRARRTDLF